MGPPGKNRRPTLSRRLFRHGRALCLTLGLALLALYIYLAEFGLPGFLENRLRAELHARGVQLEFGRMRLRTPWQIVADNVRLAQTAAPDGPSLTFREVVVRFRLEAWFPPALAVKGLDFEAGQLSLPAPSPDAPADRLLVDAISAQLQLLPQDRWDLNHLQARCLGARFFLDASLTNASAVASWDLKRPSNSPPFLWDGYVREALRWSREFRFGAPPDVLLTVSGDARQPAAVRAKLNVRANDAITSWGSLGKLALDVHVAGPPTPNEPVPCRLELQVDQVRTRWTTVRQGRLQTRWDQTLRQTLPVRWDWELALDDVRTPWGESPQLRGSGQTERSADDPNRLNSRLELASGRYVASMGQARTNRLSARFSHDSRSLIPITADWEYVATSPQGGSVGADRLALSGTLRQRTANPVADDRWGWWAALERFEIDWHGEIDHGRIDSWAIDSVSVGGSWDPPVLRFDRFAASVPAGTLEGRGSLDIPTRRLEVTVQGDLQPAELNTLFPDPARSWLAGITAAENARLSTRMQAQLPPWTGGPDDWMGAVLATLGLAGELSCPSLTFRDVGITNLLARAAYTNQTLNLLELSGGQEENHLQLSGSAHLPSATLAASLDAHLNPAWLQPLSPAAGQRAFEVCRFAQPLSLQASLSGSWNDLLAAQAVGHLHATNFVALGQPVDDLQMSLSFTNRQLVARQVRILTGPEWVHADSVGFDPATRVVSLTNASAWILPEKVTRLLGANTDRDLRPYHFLKPIRALVNGWVNVTNTHQADMSFRLSGGPFNYWRFNSQDITTDVRWSHDTVTVTNLQAEFYGGATAGELFADLRPRPNAEVSFNFHVSNANLNGLMRDLQSPTNRLEGVLSGDLTITRLIASDWGSWQGHGRAYLRDGFLWDIPMFSILTPVFNGIVPGIANSRVTGGTCTCIITNSLIVSSDVDIQSTAMRLNYRGSVDFEGRVDARAEARLLPDMFLVGPLVSLAFTPISKLLEFRVTGTLDQPKLELQHIPKPFLFPFLPFKGIEKLIDAARPTPAPPPAAPTNAPPRGPLTAPATAPEPPTQSDTSRTR